MVDLNLWRLAYNDTVLEFGTHESGHPFTRQVVVGPAALDTDDAVHPLSEGIVFGRDHARGRTLAFAGAHLSTARPALFDPRWTRPMDDSGAFEQAWRGRWLRDAPGRVATLANVDRERLVYGRPRPYAPNHEKARHGWLTYECAFDTTDPRFYSTTEKVAAVTVAPASLGAFTFPMTFPFTRAQPAESRSWLTNDGTDDTWPVITFNRGTNPRLELLNDAGGVAWAIEVRHALAYDEYVTVDTRPWSRAVTLNGTPAPGLLRGSALDRLAIPAGNSEARLIAADPSGLANVTLRWRDAYGTL